MLTVTFQEFMTLVEQRKLSDHRSSASPSQERAKVLRDDQLLSAKTEARQRHLATCPQCDSVVDSEIIHPRSGLCPICHDEDRRRPWR